MGIVRKLYRQDTNGMFYIRINKYVRNLLITNLFLFRGFHYFISVVFSLARFPLTTTALIL